MRASPNHMTWAEKSCSDFSALLKVGIVETEIECGCGLRQCDNISPIVFLFFAQLVVEDMLAALKDISVGMINLKHDNANGKMKLHNLKDVISITKKEVSLLACIDDGAFIFKDGKHLIEDSKIIREAMVKWGLTMHAGSVDKNIKVMFCTLYVVRK